MKIYFHSYYKFYIAAIQIYFLFLSCLRSFTQLFLVGGQVIAFDILFGTKNINLGTISTWFSHEFFQLYLWNESLWNLNHNYLKMHKNLIRYNIDTVNRNHNREVLFGFDRNQTSKFTENLIILIKTFLCGGVRAED